MNNPDILERDAAAQLAKETGISNHTVRDVVCEYKKTGVVTSPNRKKRRLSIKDKIDDYDKNAIRKKIHEFYRNKQLPTLDKVLQTVNADENLPNFKHTTFYSLLKELNYIYIKGHRNSILTEREDLILWRRNYLRSIKRYREEGRQIYYLDETLINTDDVISKVWMNRTIKSKKDVFLQRLTAGLVNPSGNGTRLILLHIGSAAGFVPGGFLCFELKKHTGDYNDEMNDSVFLEWFKNILPLLDENSVIVMDNAPYHSMKLEKLPNISWKKDEIIKWLQNKGKEVSESMVKVELLQIVEQQKNKYDKYVIDELAKQNNKMVLRLPPYHCQLNPIEMVWTMVKGYVKSNKNTFETQDIKVLLEQCINQVTAEHWRNCIRHVTDEEKKMWEIDYIVDRMSDDIPPLIINVTDETDSDSD